MNKLGLIKAGAIALSLLAGGMTSYVSDKKQEQLIDDKVNEALSSNVINLASRAESRGK